LFHEDHHSVEQRGRSEGAAHSPAALPGNDLARTHLRVGRRRRRITPERWHPIYPINSAASREYLSKLKERLKQEFQQLDILVIERDVGLV
jgi:hypothetical protein